MVHTGSPAWTHISAVFISLALHTILLAWAIGPLPTSRVPKQQLIKITPILTTQPPVKTRTLPSSNAPSPHQEAAPNMSTATQPTTTHAAFTQPIPAQYVDNPEPHYPIRARRNGIQGTVLLDVIVGADGTAQSVKIAASSGHDILDHIARQTVKKWRFIPAKHHGKPIEAGVEVPIQFQLN